METICSVLESAALQIPDKPLFVFPETRWHGTDVLTYGELASRSAAAAKVISEYAQPGDCALLMFPTGSAFWEAFLGCLAAGVIAVPLNIPNINRTSEQLREVCRDCTPRLLMTDISTSELLDRRSEKHPYFTNLAVCTPDLWDTAESVFSGRIQNADQTAFLQYTSGSTAQPRGVQISHRNLMSNLMMIRDQMGIRAEQDSGVTWLPHYHDMGLVGSYLETLYTRNTTSCLPPEDFALRPVRWLESISEARATVCGGPDFAYRACAEKISSDQLAGLDLSSWRVAFVGAERIRPETLQRFTEKFSACGFQDRAFFPCYGLGEATLIAAGGPAWTAPRIRSVSKTALTENRIASPVSPDDNVVLCGSGETIPGTEVVIQNPESLNLLPDDVIGEVCLSGPSITNGYFQRPELNAELFRDVTVGGVTDRFLRTGDLGFLSEGELFITGRMKEIIIVRGRNLYPEDIEQRAGASHPLLSPGSIVAFSVEQDGREVLIIAAELPRSVPETVVLQDVIEGIHQSVAAGFGVNPEKILLLRAASIPKTSSGKPRRLTVRARFLDGSLNDLAANVT